MSRSNNIILLIIIVVFALSIWAIVPNSQFSKAVGREGMRLGLDLQGGVQLVYQVQSAANATASDQTALIDATILKIEQRIDKFGVVEPVVQKVGSDRILIQLPGFTDIESAKNLVQQTGFLEFRRVELNASGQPVHLKDYLAQTTHQFINATETGTRVFSAQVASTTTGTNEPKYETVAFLKLDNGKVILTDANGAAADNSTLAQYGNLAAWIPARGSDGTPLTGDLLDDAQAIMENSTAVGEPAVSIKWNSQGSVIFDEIAQSIYNSGDYGTEQRALGIFLDNTLLSYPQIKETHYGGSGVISGSFNVKQAETLATLLKSGSLPMPLGNPIFQDKVSATLGAQFVEKSLIAGLIGILLVMAFMIAYYRLPGLMASIALLFYGTLTLTIFKLWPVTMSLGDIGGFIVSMGIAVDANVLIFERLKEEYRTGRTIGACIEAGFHRAWSAIWDSNVTTFIACIILYWLGSSAMHNAAVIGFAVTLFIGAIVSMFTAVLVTRTLLRWSAGTGLAKHPALFTMTGGKK
jgi:preprotein translocase subunit SecD